MYTRDKQRLVHHMPKLLNLVHPKEIIPLAFGASIPQPTISPILQPSPRPKRYSEAGLSLLYSTPLHPLPFEATKKLFRNFKRPISSPPDTLGV